MSGSDVGVEVIGSEGDEESPLLTDAQRDRQRTSAMNVLMYALGLRDHSEFELRSKLEKHRRGFHVEVIDWAMDEMRRMGLVDDESFARSFFRSKQEYQSRGVRRIGWELRQKGVDQSIIDAVAEEFSDEERELERALKVARSRVRQSRGVEVRKRWARVMGVLVRAGYSSGVAREATEIALAEELNDNDED